MKQQKNPIITDEIVMSKIFFIRNQKVMMDRDLAELYGVSTKVLKQAVRRNIIRFPEDFMFELKKEEYLNLRSHFVTSNSGGTRYLPMAFTEHGVLMLSSVLRSNRAIEMNIQIMRIFTKMKQMLFDHRELLLRIEQIEKKSKGHDNEILALFEYLKKLMTEKKQTIQQESRKRIGYKSK